MRVGSITLVYLVLLLGLSTGSDPSFDLGLGRGTLLFSDKLASFIFLRLLPPCCKIIDPSSDYGEKNSSTGSDISIS